MPNFHGATKGSSNERGYGWQDHQLPRARAWPLLPDGAPCCICGKPMDKNAYMTDRLGRRRSLLHYDHNDARTGHLGFSHARCNTLKGAAKGGRVAMAKRRHHPRRWHSRTW